MTRTIAGWVVDPDDPRAPPTEVWEKLTPEQKAAVIAALPSEFPAPDLLERLREVKTAALHRVQQLEAELAEERRLREEESQRREAAEAELAALRAELEKLRRG